MAVALPKTSALSFMRDVSMASNVDLHFLNARLGELLTIWSMFMLIYVVLCQLSHSVEVVFSCSSLTIIVV